MLPSRTLIKKKGSSSNIENLFLVSYRFLQNVPQKNFESFFRCNRPPIVGVLFSYFLSHQLRQTVELLDIRSKKRMKFLFILEQIWMQVAKYPEFWSFYVYRVHPHVPSLTTPPPSPHNRVQNKHVRILHRYRVRCFSKIAKNPLGLEQT